MIAYWISSAIPTQFASGWHVENRVLWIVIGVLFILLLAAVYFIVRTRWGHADSPPDRSRTGGPP
jgi:hypothetical protein